MAEPPPAPKQISLRDLLTGLLSSAVVFALIGGQMLSARSPAPPPEIGYADTALAANNLKQAQREFEKLIAQAPDAPVVYTLVVSECLLRNRPDWSLAYAYRAIDACKYAPNPSRAELYLLLSELYLRRPEDAAQPLALEYSRRAFELDPENALALNGYGYALLESAHSLSEVNRALGYIQKALQILRAQTSPAPVALAALEDSYGWGLYRRGQYTPADYPLAVSALHQALDDVPEAASGMDRKVYYYHLGAANRAAGRIGDARHALQVALYYDPHYAEALKEMQALPPDAASSIPPAVAAPPLLINGKPAFQPLDKTPAKR